MNTYQERQIVLDTETTGMNQAGGNHFDGHKIIEIGAVELINRRLTGNHFHVYINPERLIDEEAFKIHGISNEAVKDAPVFKDIAQDFIKFIDKAELVIHNAPFDVGFMDYEFRLAGLDFKTRDHCQITDTLTLARRLFPGKRNSLDALCERYQIDNSHRILHGALLDAEILADVYLTMTGGQTSLSFAKEEVNLNSSETLNIKRVNRGQTKLKIIKANELELNEHKIILEKIVKKGGYALWSAK